MSHGITTDRSFSVLAPQPSSLLAFLELTKPTITALVLATTAIGYLLAGGQPGKAMALTLLGTGLASAAAGCLNQWLECEQDGLMARTRHRPIPSGRVPLADALGFGLLLAASGLILQAFVGTGALALTVLTLVLYLAAYTPLKRYSPQSTWLGAAAGAMPPLIGWIAAQGRLQPMAWILFGVQFLWQIPHFLTLFWIHREDYARAGFQVMAVADPDGKLTAFQIAIHSFAVLPLSLLPSLAGGAGSLYGASALALGTAYMVLGMRASWTLAHTDAQCLFFGSLVYLPAIFSMMLLGGV